MVKRVRGFAVFADLGSLRTFYESVLVSETLLCTSLCGILGKGSVVSGSPPFFESFAGFLGFRVLGFVSKV